MAVEIDKIIRILSTMSQEQMNKICDRGNFTNGAAGYWNEIERTRSVLRLLIRTPQTVAFGFIFEAVSKLA